MSEHAPSAIPQPINGEQKPNPPHRRVLVIDDDPKMRASVRTLLCRNGFDVTETETADEGLRLARLTLPDAVVCDYSLPDTNGLEALKILRADPATALLPFFMITGDADATKIMRRGMSGGADDFLHKPFAVEELITAIEERLKQRTTQLNPTEQEVSCRLQRELSETLSQLEAQAQAARLQSTALEAAANGIVIADRTGRILWVNPAFTKLTGYTREEAIGHTPAVLKSGTHPPEFYQNLWQTVLSGDVWSGHLVNQRKDGSLYDEDMTITPVRDEHGTVQNFIAIKQDVTKRKKFEQELSHERDLLQSLMDNLPDLIYFKDDRSRFTRINRALARHLGLSSPEAAVGLSDADYFPQYLARQKLTDERRLLAVGEPIIGLVERSETDGMECWVSSTKIPLRDVAGNVTGLVGISRDITKFKQVEEALREGQARYHSLFENMLEGFARCQMLFAEGRPNDFIYLEVNPAFETLTGLKNVIGRKVSEVIPGVTGTNPELFEIYSRMTLGGRPEKFETLLKPLGVWLSVTVYRQEEERFITMFDNITERKQAEKARQEMEIQLRQGQKLESIGQLAAGIAHEINTPTQYIGDNTRFLADAFKDLNSLLAHLEKLAAATPETTPGILAELRATAGQVDCQYLCEEIPRAIQQSLEGVDRVTKIVRAMKEFSHPGTTEKTAVDLNHAIDVTLSVSRNEWKYIAEVKTEFDATLPLVPCLPGEFNQVILNLIVNAAHAIADVVGKTGTAKGLITASTRRDDGWVEVRIQDTGTGIPETARPRMFEPFFTTKGVGKGTGQGLAIAHTVIVKKHGGTIYFETETGKGTTFIIRLPLTSTKPEARP